MVPARRLYLLLGLGIAIAPLFSLLANSQTSILLTLLYDCIVIGLAIWDARQVKRDRVQVTRPPLQKLSIGRDNPVILTVQSGSRDAQILLRDSYPQDFPVSTQTFEVVLPAHSTQDLIYTICPHQRGEFVWGDIQVRQLGNWGLAWHDWTIQATQTVAVYPDLMGLRSLSIRLAIENTGTMRQVRRLGAGSEFSELRDYSTGDDTRLIDWKATARRNRPLVRVLEPEKEQTLIILLDCGRLMTAQVQGMQRFDWGLNVTLSLALAGLNRGDRVGIGVFDSEIKTWIPPQTGQHHLAYLIERLTPLQPVLKEPDYFGVVSQLVKQQTRRALVVLITDLVDRTASAELLSAMVRLVPRYLPFCVALRDPQVDEIAHTPTPVSQAGLKPRKIIEAAYNRAVALDLLAQREIALAQIKQQGVLVLDAPANQVSDQLVERYLQLKARNLL